MSFVVNTQIFVIIEANGSESMSYILEGNISVKAALQAGKRPIHTILVDPSKQDKDTAYILRNAKEQGIPIQMCEREVIDALAQGKTHGGLVAKCGERSFSTLDDMRNREDLLLGLVEGVEDPFNFGYVLRSFYAAGCDAILIPPRNWTSAAGVVAKASAGASEYIDMIIMEDIPTILATLKKEHITLVCGQRNDAISLYEYAFPKKVCIAIGGELRGLSRTIRDASDQNVFIPYRQDFRNAMTAAASTSIISFEYVRQKQQ